MSESSSAVSTFTRQILESDLATSLNLTSALENIFNGTSVEGLLERKSANQVGKDEKFSKYHA